MTITPNPPIYGIAAARMGLMQLPWCAVGISFCHVVRSGVYFYQETGGGLPLPQPFSRKEPA